MDEESKAIINVVQCLIVSYRINWSPDFIKEDSAVIVICVDSVM